MSQLSRMPDPVETEAAPERKGLFVVYAAIAIALMAAGYVFRSDLAKLLFKLEGVIGILGPAAPLGMAVICGIWGALCLPGPLMQGTVGTLFASEPLVALAVVVAGETIAQIIAYGLARSVGREKVRHKLEGKPWFKRLEEETAKKGFYGVFVFRLMPFFPNALGSYAFGLTSLKFWPYVVASVLGSFPKMVLYIYGTTSVVKLFRTGSISAQTLTAAAGGVVVLAIMGRLLQLRLRRPRAEESPAS